MKVDSRGEDMEENSARQNSVNRDMENRNEESGNNLSTDAENVHDYNYPVDQLMGMDDRMEEKHLLIANVYRAGNNNGDGDTVRDRTSRPVKQRGGR